MLKFCLPKKRLADSRRKSANVRARNGEETRVQPAAVASTPSSAQSPPAEPPGPPERKRACPPKWRRPAAFDRRHVKDAARRDDGTGRADVCRSGLRRGLIELTTAAIARIRSSSRKEDRLQRAGEERPSPGSGKLSMRYGFFFPSHGKKIKATSCLNLENLQGLDRTDSCLVPGRG